MLNIIIFFIGIIGAVLVSYGSWLVYQPVGYIVAGVLCVAWSFFAARTVARQSQTKEES